MADINKILADAVKADPGSITDELKLTDVKGWDSLKHMNLIISLETALGIQFEMTEIVSMDTVGSIKNILKSKGLDV